MVNTILNLIPNVVAKYPELIKSTLQTLYMVGVTGAISFFIGLFIGVILVVTRKGGIFESPILWLVLDKVINFFRSIPFIILMAMLIPVSRYIMGTAIGTSGALVPLIFGTVPFFSRQIESALLELDKGLIETAESMGTSGVGIIFRVYLKESIPSIVRGTAITFVSLVGLTAMAGAVGGGGLGDFAIRYGYQRYQADIIYVTVLVLVAIVTMIQWVGNIIIKRTTH